MGHRNQNGDVVPKQGGEFVSVFCETSPSAVQNASNQTDGSAKCFTTATELFSQVSWA
jgi:hypothetical protein